MLLLFSEVLRKIFSIYRKFFLITASVYITIQQLIFDTFRQNFFIFLSYHVLIYSCFRFSGRLFRYSGKKKLKRTQEQFFLSSHLFFFAFNEFCGYQFFCRQLCKHTVFKLILRKCNFVKISILKNALFKHTFIEFHFLKSAV